MSQFNSLIVFLMCERDSDCRGIWLGKRKGGYERGKGVMMRYYEYLIGLYLDGHYLDDGRWGYLLFTHCPSE